MELKNKENLAISPPTDSTVERGTNRPALSIPRPEDGVDEVIFKLTAILDAIRAGQSISQIMTNLTDPNQRKSPRIIAKNQMTPQEYEAWTTFNNGLWHLPEIDWDKNQLRPHSSLKSRQKARRRAEALNRLYKTDRAHEGHVTWIVQNEIWFLPLIKATARIIGAERSHKGGAKWHATQLTELQSVNRILSICTQICQGSKSKLLRSKCGETQSVLGNYRRTLQASRSRKSASSLASEEIIGQIEKRELDDSKIRIPPQCGIEKVFPERNQLRLYRLNKYAAFNCDRCGGQKTSKLVAFAQDQYGKPVCNGCYGNLCSRYETR